MNRKLCEQQKILLSKKFSNKTVLVTGATGLIGSNLVLYLIGLNDKQRANIRIVAFYRSEQKLAEVYQKLSGREDIEFVSCDVEGEILYEKNIDYVVHCAGYSGGTKMHLNAPIKVFDTGIDGTRHLLDFAVRHQCTGFLYVSTYEVYGEVSQERYITEQQPCQLDTFVLRNCYAEIKRLCESLLCAYSAQYGLPVYAARLTSTFGNGVQYDDPRFFAEFARCILEGKDIILKSAGRTVRSYLDVNDAASAFLYILSCGDSGNAYNVTNMENEISIKDMAKRMIELAGSSIRLITAEADHGESAGFRKEGRTVIDASRLESLGWKPVYTLDETVMSMFNSMKEQEDYYQRRIAND